MNNLFKRVLVGAIGIPFALVVIYFGGWTFTIVISIIAAGTAYELIRVAKRIPIETTPWIAVIASAAMPVVSMLWGVSGMMIFFLLTVLVLSISSLLKSPAQGFAGIMLNVFTVVYSGILFSAMILLRNSGIENDVIRGGWLLLFAMAGVWIADSAAFFVGSYLGRHRMSPVLSPNKTYEGTICGILAAVAWGIWAPMMPEAFLGFADRAVLGAIIGVMAVLGDLTESMIKRAVNLKDSSNLFPGHGGMLDRFDSLLIVLPSVYVYLVLRGILTM
ncbi:MAG: phosphatidate cytidylyltransferase [bacterium]